MQDRIRIRKEEILSDDWAVLKKTTFDYQRMDGRWESQTRQTYDRGGGAAILPYDPDRGTVLLVRQFRYPAYVTGHTEPLIETCAGLLEGDDPESCIRKEALEELGYRMGAVRLLFAPFMSPGAVTERLWLFAARYSPTDRVSAGGGEEHEGEDIEVLEMAVADAVAAIRDGRIVDAKTIILLQQLQLDPSLFS